MLFLYRSILLMVCAGLSVCVVAYVIGFIDRGYDAFTHLTMVEMYHLFLLFAFGNIFCLIFGVPFLFLIEKYIKNFQGKYIVLGGVLGWVECFLIECWFSTLHSLINPSSWNWRLEFVFSFVGLSTGILFTLFSKFLPAIKMRDRVDESLKLES